MATLLWQRDNVVSSDVSSVKDTFSSWDKCMAKPYCKWPAIIAIIVGSLLALSVIWCLVRCICCGAACCCECFSCCNSLFQSGRRRKQGYKQHQQPPPATQPYQYQSSSPPMYANPQYAQPYGSKGPIQNVDSVPLMPSWDNSRASRMPVPNNDVEMDRLNTLNNHPAAPMIPHSSYYGGSGGDLGMMGGPGFAQDTAYHHTIPPASYDDPYAGYSGGAPLPSQRQSAYAPPPSYRSRPPSAAPPLNYQSRPPSAAPPLDYQSRHNSLAPPLNHQSRPPSAAPPMPMHNSWRDV